mmetsp:Transcript_12530/g.26516  ORF Transcript_12530/g.26516 Transcript_12530/m.26516 type:complete len:538 (+) Transcript_12530:164-1777(+)
MTDQDEPPPSSSTLREPLLLHHQPDQHDDDHEPREPVSSINATPCPRPQRLVDGMPPSTSLLLKSLYFLEALGSSTWGRFGTIYYNLHGLNSAQIGLIEGLMPVVRAVSQPFWGYVSDEFHCRKYVYLICKAGSTVILLLLALPWVYESWMRMLTVTLSTRLFAASGILDSYTLDVLGTANRMKYGRYRLWAGVSWGLGSVLIGLITDRFGFEPNFVLFAVLAAITLGLIAWKIPDTVREDVGNDEDDSHTITARDDVDDGVGGSSEEEQRQDIASSRSSNIMDLVRLAMQPRVAGFMVETVVMGAGMATVERLLFLYLVNDLGSTNLLCGLSVGINVMIEIPIFWYAERIMGVLGHDGMFAMSMICFFTRVYGYTLLTPATRWFVLPLEATHGITFALFWVASTDVTKALINQAGGWNTTIPMVVQTLYNSVGVGIGSIVGGWAMKEYGSRDMYRCVAAVVLALFVFHVTASVVSRICFKTQFLPDHEGSRERGEEAGRVNNIDVDACDGVVEDDEEVSCVFCPDDGSLKGKGHTT